VGKSVESVTVEKLKSVCAHAIIETYLIIKPILMIYRRLRLFWRARPLSLLLVIFTFCHMRKKSD
jgi:hypothetical protein